MDRASILGDVIEYLKELLQRINNLHNELESTSPDSSLPPTTSFHPLTPTPPTLPCRVKEELCPSSLSSPNSQPARVEVRVREGRAVNIHMFCARRPGLLLSTMKALDVIGLDIQQAVISCFNGFALDVFRAECKNTTTIQLVMEDMGIEHHGDAFSHHEMVDGDDSFSQKTKSFSGLKTISDNTNCSFDCNICLDYARDPVLTLCSHLYCWPCIFKWLRLEINLFIMTTSPFVATVNGEIYNHEALRKSLPNHRFQIDSECEVIAYLIVFGLCNSGRRRHLSLSVTAA